MHLTPPDNSTAVIQSGLSSVTPTSPNISSAMSSVGGGNELGNLGSVSSNSVSAAMSGVGGGNEFGATGSGVLDLGAAKVNKTDPGKHKVTIEGGDAIVRFEASAPISESRSASYEGYNITHLPTSMLAYRNTNGRHFGISGKFVSRNLEEARTNSRYLSTIRSWILPTFGVGATPPILYLTAYNNTNIQATPCVLINYNCSFPEDVDYIYGDGYDDPMPIIMTVTLELEEVYSPQQITYGSWVIPPRSSALSTGVPGLATNVLGNQAAGFGGISTALSKGPSTLGGLLGSVTGALGAVSGAIKTVSGVVSAASSAFNTVKNLTNVIKTAGNSPQITSVTNQISAITNNRFISGVTPNPTVTPTGTQTVVTPPNDPFGRSTNLTPPSLPT